jgi:rubrerythrin
MSPIPKASAQQLTSAARELGAEALRGRLERNEAGRWMVGHIEVESWLSRHQGLEVVVAVAAIDEEEPIRYMRVCRTCGNEYEGRVCPHCEAVRRRLRGG